MYSPQNGAGTCGKLLVCEKSWPGENKLFFISILIYL